MPYLKRGNNVSDTKRFALTNRIRNEHWEKLHKSGKTFDEIAAIFNVDARQVEDELRWMEFVRGE